MNILIIGGTGSLINQLIKKLKKEGHRVHLLTGDRYADSKYEKVVERYNFPYDSECLTDVFDSVNPDVTIFMGAYDTNFHWQNEQKEMVRFTSGFTNLLMAYSMSGKGRFIFLSSEEIYSGNYDSDIAEEEGTTPVSVKGMALAEAEEICQTFVRIRGYDIVTLRLDRYYRVPKVPEDVDEICTWMCFEAMKTGSINAGSEERLSLLYESDAVEFIYQIVKCEKHIHSVYNLSSSREITELEIAKYIQEDMGEDASVKVEEKDNSKCGRRILSNARFDSEFGVRIFADDKKIIGDIVGYMTSHREEFLTGEQCKKTFIEKLTEKAGWFVRAMIPYLENAVFFLIFFILNSLVLSSRFFSRLDLYLLYVLLFAVVHGQQQATFSAILAVLGYFFSQTGSRSLLNVVLDYNTYIWIAQLFIVGLVVGYMKDQIIKLRTEAEEEHKYLNRQLSDIKDINGSNVRVKDALETQIVNQSDSIGKIYAITSRLEKYTPEEVLFYAVEIVREFLSSEDIAIYTISNAYYARLFTFTSEKARSLGNSIRYRELGALYDNLAAKKVYINRTLDERYPMMAAPVFDRDDMQIMIMAWGIPWERMTLGQADLLMVVSYLIQNAVLRAARYITMLENRRYEEGKLVMAEDAFTSLVKVFLEARDKHLTECVLIKLGFPDVLPETDAENISNSEQKSVAGVVPIVASIGDSEPEKTPEPDVAAMPETTDYQKEHLIEKPATTHTVYRAKGLKGLVARLKAVSLNIHIGNTPLVKTYPQQPVQQEPIQPVNAPETVSADNEESKKTLIAAAPIVIPKTESSEKENSNGRDSRYEEIAKGLVGKIRNTDYVGVLEDGNMYVLLCNTNSTDAASAVERIQSGGYHCDIVEDFRI